MLPYIVLTTVFTLTGAYALLSLHEWKLNMELRYHKARQAEYLRLAQEELERAQSIEDLSYIPV